MDFKKIKKLVSLVETSDISSLSVEEDNLKVEIKREGPTQIIQSSIPAQPVQAAAPIQQAAPAAVDSQSAPQESNDTAGLIEIKSPMVGTFYASPNPESPAFVEVGKTIKKGDVVCIIEAMKLFNEIEAEIEGTIEKVCLKTQRQLSLAKPSFLFANKKPMGDAVWQVFPKQTDIAKRISNQLNCAPVVGQLLLNRSISSIEQARCFLTAEWNEWPVLPNQQ